MRLKKQSDISNAPTREVMHVVANGGTEPGMHAKMMTSVDQHRVTHIRQMFACIEFIEAIIHGIAINKVK